MLSRRNPLSEGTTKNLGQSLGTEESQGRVVRCEDDSISSDAHQTCGLLVQNSAQVLGFG
jgi:hypothetical protein